jgi:hypothetical protein
MITKFDSKGVSFSEHSVIHVDEHGRLYYKESRCDKRHYFSDNNKCCNSDPKFRICSVSTGLPGSLPTISLVREGHHWCFNFTFPPFPTPPTLLNTSFIPFASGTPSLISTRVLIGGTTSVADTIDFIGFANNFTHSSSDLPALSIAGLGSDTFTLAADTDNSATILPTSGSFLSFTASVTVVDAASVPSGTLQVRAGVFVAPPNSNVYTRPGANLNDDVVICTLSTGGLGTFSTTKTLTNTYAAGTSILVVIYGLGSTATISQVTVRSKAGLKITQN